MNLLARSPTGLAVLVLTARDAVRDRVEGFERGADDYLVKPFAMAELLARVRASVGAAGRSARHAAASGDLELARPARVPARRRAALADQQGVRGAGDVVVARRRRRHPRAELVEHCWDELTTPMSNAVDVVVSQLRRKLGEPPVIETVRGGRLSPRWLRRNGCARADRPERVLARGLTDLRRLRSAPHRALHRRPGGPVSVALAVLVAAQGLGASPRVAAGRDRKLGHGLLAASLLLRPGCAAARRSAGRRHHQGDAGDPGPGRHRVASTRRLRKHRPAPAPCPPAGCRDQPPRAAREGRTVAETVSDARGTDVRLVAGPFYGGSDGGPAGAVVSAASLARVESAHNALIATIAIGCGVLVICASGAGSQSGLPLPATGSVGLAKNGERPRRRSRSSA